MSPSAMTEIIQHLSSCAIPTQQLIFAEIESRGRNRSDRPFDMSYHDDEWWIYIDVDMPAATFDVETHNADQLVALTNALSRVRRNFYGTPTNNKLTQLIASHA